MAFELTANHLDPIIKALRIVRLMMRVEIHATFGYDESQPLCFSDILVAAKRVEVLNLIEPLIDAIHIRTLQDRHDTR